MDATTIVKTAYSILTYALNRCDVHSNFTGKTSELMETLKINDDRLITVSLTYLRTSEMVSVAQAHKNDNEIIVNGIGFKAINWLAGMK